MTLKNGLPCKKCGTQAWYKGGVCIECSRRKNKTWRQENAEEYKEKRRKYRQANHDRELKRYQDWAKVNIERVRQLKRESKRRHRERALIVNREWQRNNPEKMKSYYHARQTKKRNAGGSFTESEWRELCKQYGNRCVCCGKKKELHADHVVPVSKGGTSDISNIQPLCKSCNSRKSNKTIDYRTKPGIGRWIQKKLFGD